MARFFLFWYVREGIEWLSSTDDLSSWLHIYLFFNFRGTWEREFPDEWCDWPRVFWFWVYKNLQVSTHQKKKKKEEKKKRNNYRVRVIERVYIFPRVLWLIYLFIYYYCYYNYYDDDHHHSIGRIICTILKSAISFE